MKKILILAVLFITILLGIKTTYAYNDVPIFSSDFSSGIADNWYTENINSISTVNGATKFYPEIDPALDGKLIYDIGLPAGNYKIKLRDVRVNYDPNTTPENDYSGFYPFKITVEGKIPPIWGSEEERIPYNETFNTYTAFISPHESLDSIVLEMYADNNSDNFSIGKIEVFEMNTPDYALSKMGISSTDPTLSSFDKDTTLNNVDIYFNGSQVVNENQGINGYQYTINQSENTATLIRPDNTQIIIRGSSASNPNTLSAEIPPDSYYMFTFIETAAAEEPYYSLNDYYYYNWHVTRDDVIRNSRVELRTGNVEHFSVQRANKAQIFIDGVQYVLNGYTTDNIYPTFNKEFTSYGSIMGLYFLETGGSNSDTRVRFYIDHENQNYNIGDITVFNLDLEPNQDYLEIDMYLPRNIVDSTPTTPTTPEEDTIIPDGIKNLMKNMGLWNSEGFVITFTVLMILINIGLAFSPLGSLSIIIVDLLIFILFAITGFIPLWVSFIIIMTIIFLFTLYFKGGTR